MNLDSYARYFQSKYILISIMLDLTLNIIFWKSIIPLGNRARIACRLLALAATWSGNDPWWVTAVTDAPWSRNSSTKGKLCSRIAQINGVLYIDDSKGTNLGATEAALEGFGSAERKLKSDIHVDLRPNFNHRIIRMQRNQGREDIQIRICWNWISPITQ